jgi:hypothetical protein
MAPPHTVSPEYLPNSILESTIPRVTAVAFGRSERLRANITVVRGYSRAGGKANTALDAIGKLDITDIFLLRLEELPGGYIDFRIVPNNVRFDLAMFLKEVDQIGDQVLDDRKIREWFDVHAIRSKMRNLCVASETGITVDEHATRATNAHSA